MEKVNDESIDSKRQYIKKLIRAGYLSGFAFLFSFFVYAISVPRGCVKEITTICGAVKTDSAFSYLSIIIFFIFSIIIFLLISQRIEYRKDQEVIKEIGIGKSVIAMLLILISGFFFIMVMFVGTLSSSRCKAVDAMKKSELNQLIAPQAMYFDNNNHHYANTFQELVDNNLITKDSIKRLEELGIEMKSENFESWHADVKFSATEHRFPCSDKVTEIVYTCDQNGCRYKN